MSWWNNNWGYRREVTIDNSSSGSSLSDFQIKVTIDTASLVSAGKMNSDGSDIRFIDSDDSTQLNYWIEDGTMNTSSTVIWVKVPSIPASSTKTIYMYYGNPSATAASDGSNVFDFWEDFDSYTTGDLNGQGGWAGDTYFDVENSVSTTNPNGVIYDVNDASARTISLTLSSDISEGILHISVRQDTEYTSEKLNFIYIYDSAGDRFLAYQMWGSGGSVHRWWDSGNWHSGSTYTLGQWYDLDMYFRNSDDKIRYFIDGSELTSGWTGTYGGNDATLHKITLGGLGAKDYWDTIYVRKYASSEPTTSVGNEEEYSLSEEISETITISDDISFKLIRIITETTTLSDSKNTTTSKIISETITPSDIKSFAIEKTISESTSLLDSINAQIIIIKTIIESVSLTDSISKDISKLISEQFNLTDKISKGSSTTLTSEFSINDAINKLTSTTLSDSQTLSDGMDKLPIKTIDEIFNTSDKISKGSLATLTEMINISDSLSKKIPITITDQLTAIDSSFQQKVSVEKLERDFMWSALEDRPRIYRTGYE